MIALIIIGLVVLVFAVILLLPIVFVIDYENQAAIKVRLLFFDIFSEKKAEKRKVKHNAAQTKKKSAANKSASPVKLNQPQKAEKTGESPNTTLKTKKKSGKGIEKNVPAIDMKLIRIMVDSAAHPLKRLIKKIKITELYIDSIAGGGDAAKAALNYGVQNAAVYSAVAWLESVSTVNIERINIQADFMREDSVFLLHFKVKIKIGTVILCALIFFIKFIRIKARKTESRTSEKARI